LKLLSAFEFEDSNIDVQSVLVKGYIWDFETMKPVPFIIPPPEVPQHYANHLGIWHTHDDEDDDIYYLTDEDDTQ